MVAPQESQPDKVSGTFKVLYFATARSYTGKEEEALPAPLAVGALFAELDRRYRGMAERVLGSCRVAINWEYVDVAEDAERMVGPGDEVGIVPPVSSG
jgi:molybdopterin converting factor small subunit